MKFYSRVLFRLCNSLILITTLVSLLNISDALAADLKLFEGTWSGRWERTSGSERGTSGGLITEFTEINNQLEGTHYGVKMDKVELEGRTVIFEHPYKDCRAVHTFTIDLNDNTKAQSTYTVKDCKGAAENHDGKIDYKKQ